MPDDQTADVDWSNVTEKMSRMILERGDTCLKAQLDIALASDRRALTVASVFATVGVGIIGAVITYFDQKHSWPILSFRADDRRLHGNWCILFVLVSTTDFIYSPRFLRWSWCRF